MESGRPRRSSVSLPLRDNQVALTVIPLVTQSDSEWRRIAFFVKLSEFALVVLFEQIDRAHVASEESQVPFVAVEVPDRNTRIVLHDGAAVIEDEIANAR